MSRILTVALFVLTLSAPVLADTYNRSAMPKAAAGLQQETVGCKARWTAKEFKTYSEWQSCQLTAERGFAGAIALTKMDAFEVYAADMQALAVDRDAHRVTDRQVRSRAEEIQRKFLADCGCKPNRGFAGNYMDGSDPRMGMPSGDVPMVAAVHVDNPFEAPHGRSQP